MNSFLDQITTHRRTTISLYQKLWLSSFAREHEILPTLFFISFPVHIRIPRVFFFILKISSNYSTQQFIASFIQICCTDFFLSHFEAFANGAKFQSFKSEAPLFLANPFNSSVNSRLLQSNESSWKLWWIINKPSNLVQKVLMIAIKWTGPNKSSWKRDSIWCERIITVFNAVFVIQWS